MNKILEILNAFKSMNPQIAFFDKKLDNYNTINAGNLNIPGIDLLTNFLHIRFFVVGIEFRFVLNLENNSERTHFEKNN